MKNRNAVSLERTLFLFLFFNVLLVAGVPLQTTAQTKPLEGKTEAGDKSSEADLMAYIAASRASSTIATGVCNELGNNNKVAVYNEDFKKQIVDYRNTYQLLESIRRRFDDALPENPFTLAEDLQIEAQALAINSSGDGERAAPVLAEAANIATGLGSINSAVSGLLDLVGFLKTNVKDTGFTTTITKDNLLPEVISRLKATCGNKDGKNVQFYMPKEMPFSVTAADSDMLETLEYLYKKRVEAQNFVDKVNSLKNAISQKETALQTVENGITAAQSSIDEATDERSVSVLENNNVNRVKAENKLRRNTDKKAALEEKRGKLQDDLRQLKRELVRLEPTKNEAEAVIKQFDAIAANLVKIDKDTPTPLLTSLFEAERVVNFIEDENNFVLEVASNAAGSTRRIKQNLILDLFITSGRITYNAVAATRYTLYQNTGNVRKACVVKTYVNFRRLSNLKTQKDDSIILNNCQIP